MDLEDYENLNSEGYYIYENIETFLDTNDIKNKDNIVINLINWPYGFGSALTVFIHNAFILNSINDKLIILPHFSNKSLPYFKYYDNELNNSFFKFYKYKNNVNLENKNIYFIKSNGINVKDFFDWDFPIKQNSINMKYLNYFNEKFTLCNYPGKNDVIDVFNKNKNGKINIGLHIRSIFQKYIHHPEYLSISMKERLEQLKIKLDRLYNDYNVFVCSDTNLYIKFAKEIFKNVYYLENIQRIEDEKDSIPQLQPSLNLGYDILNECLLLSLCDNLYITKSNIPYIIYSINLQSNFEEY